jgi:hypothetical protein
MRGRYAVRILNVTQCFRVDKLGLRFDKGRGRAAASARDEFAVYLGVRHRATHCSARSACWMATWT